MNKNRELVYGNYGGETHEALGAKLAPKYLRKFIKDKNKLELISLFIAEQEPGKMKSGLNQKLLKMLIDWIISELFICGYRRYMPITTAKILRIARVLEGEEGKKNI